MLDRAQYDVKVRRRVETILTLFAALCVFIAAGYVIFHKPSVPDVGTTPGPRASTAAAPVPSPSPSNSRSGAVAAKVLVAFLGDEYTSAAGASAKSHGFVALVSGRLGVTGRRFSVTDGGYAKSSSDGKTYADSIAAVVAAHPGVVVITGGRYDASDDLNTMKVKTASVFATLHKMLPGAVLVAVAPFWGDSDHPPELDVVAKAVKTSVQAAGGTYLALADPLHGHPNFMADAADPNDRGYAAIADALAPALAPLIPKP